MNSWLIIFWHFHFVKKDIDRERNYEFLYIYIYILGYTYNNKMIIIMMKYWKFYFNWEII